MKSDIAKLRRQAERMGYKFSHRGKHWKIQCPYGRVFGMSSSPPPSAWHPIRRQFKQHGIEI
ncbi:MAG: hypothetical protein M3441_29135 [Chloroflexota bacterium]|jgi:hypothetical protein|nr:hypothetical protein [Chloroflexota bacterium]